MGSCFHAVAVFFFLLPAFPWESFVIPQSALESRPLLLLPYFFHYLNLLYRDRDRDRDWAISVFFFYHLSIYLSIYLFKFTNQPLCSLKLSFLFSSVDDGPPAGRAAEWHAAPADTCVFDERGSPSSRNWNWTGAWTRTWASVCARTPPASASAPTHARARATDTSDAVARGCGPAVRE